MIDLDKKLHKIFRSFIWSALIQAISHFPPQLSTRCKQILTFETTRKEIKFKNSKVLRQKALKVGPRKEVQYFRLEYYNILHLMLLFIRLLTRGKIHLRLSVQSDLEEDILYLSLHINCPMFAH